MEIVTQSGSGDNSEGAIRIEEWKIHSHVDQAWGNTVGQALDAPLQAEADAIAVSLFARRVFHQGDFITAGIVRYLVHK